MTRSPADDPFGGPLFSDGEGNVAPLSPAPRQGSAASSAAGLRRPVSVGFAEPATPAHDAFGSALSLTTSPRNADPSETRFMAMNMASPLQNAAVQFKAWVAQHAPQWLGDIEETGVLSAAVIAEEDAAQSPSRRPTPMMAGPSGASPFGDDDDSSGFDDDEEDAPAEQLLEATDSDSDGELL
jgi:hypothetical protein